MGADIRWRDGKGSFTVGNISTGGLLIEGAPSPPHSTLLTIEIRQPGSKSVAVTGHVVHALPQGIGIAFEPFSTAVAQSLNSFIATVEAKNNVPPPLPPRSHKEETVPAPTGPDPFAVGPDPRPPRAGSPDERIEYLRALVKKRDESLQRGRTLFTALSSEVEDLRAASQRLQIKLDSTTGQLAIGEASLAAARRSAEQHAADLEKERAAAKQAIELERRTTGEMLEREQRETLEAIAAVAGVESKMRRFEAEVAHARKEAEAAKKAANELVSEAASLKKLREELGLANKKAMESNAALTRERASRMAADEMIREARGQQQAAVAEAKLLSAEIARLKQKLIAAESALERTAARKAHEPKPAAKR